MRKIIAAFFLAASLIVSSGCAEEPAASKQAELGALTIGLMPDVDSIPFIIAQEKGFFAEAGLKVDIKPFKSAMDRDSALQSGSLDGAVSDMLAVAFAKAGGFDVKITSLTSGSYKMIAGKQQDVDSVQALRDKEIAVSKNTIIEYVTDRILSASRIDEGDVQKVVIPQIPARLEMLQNGKLTAATLPEPMASIALGSGGKLLSSSDKLGVNPGILMFTDRAIADKRAEIAAMYKAYNKAVDYLEKEPQESYIDILIEKGGFPPAVRGALVLPEYKRAQRPKAEDLDACMRWMREKGLLQQSYTYEDLVGDGFAE